MNNKISSIQNELRALGIDGWLLYDFHRNNDLALSLLEVPEDTFLTRRLFVWIPQTGPVIRLISAIEPDALNHLPGEKRLYASWSQLHNSLELLLRECKTVAMEYSPLAAIPTVARVDAGTIELIRSFGVEVVTSAPLLQAQTSVLSEEQIKSHLEAASIVDRTVERAWAYIAEQDGVTEVDVQEFILGEFEANDCTTEERPIVAVNAHAANPHYMPDPDKPHPIVAGDLILIDLWCKKRGKNSVWADITRMGVAGEPTPRQQELFDLVKAARDAAIEVAGGDGPVMGWQVDQAARDVIEAAGYGEYFVHRTGHSIATHLHDYGANMDNLETQDNRQILPGTCFSIEPGVYIPEEIGIRMEVDLLIHPDGRVEVTGGRQEQLTIVQMENV